MKNAEEMVEKYREYLKYQIEEAKRVREEADAKLSAYTSMLSALTQFESQLPKPRTLARTRPAREAGDYQF